MEIPASPAFNVDQDASWFQRFAALTKQVDAMAGAVGLDPRTLLLERAAMLGHRSWGSVSAGGSCRLLAAADGWLAVNLPRDEDVHMVPALLHGVVVPEGRVWNVLSEQLAGLSVAEVEQQAALLGMAIAGVGTGVGARVGVGEQFAMSGATAGGPARGGQGGASASPLVVDLSSLWAGPLCGKILALSGATVLKVASLNRPDGARAGTPAFYRHLNRGKEERDVDLSDPRELHQLLQKADVVIEASRPRALRQLGFDAQTYVDAGSVWCSITGWGRTSVNEHRIAFGDDAAAAAGLVTWHGEKPQFVGDAVADPITGVTAARACFQALATGRGAMLDIPMVASVGSLL